MQPIKYLLTNGYIPRRKFCNCLEYWYREEQKASKGHRFECKQLQYSDQTETVWSEWLQVFAVLLTMFDACLSIKSSNFTIISLVASDVSNLKGSYGKQFRSIDTIVLCLASFINEYWFWFRRCHCLIYLYLVPNWPQITAWLIVMEQYCMFFSHTWSITWYLWSHLVTIYKKKCRFSRS